MVAAFWVNLSRSFSFRACARASRESAISPPSPPRGEARASEETFAPGCEVEGPDGVVAEGGAVGTDSA